MDLLGREGDIEKDEEEADEESKADSDSPFISFS